MRECPQCGNSFPTTFLYCPTDGSPLGGDEEPVEPGPNEGLSVTPLVQEEYNRVRLDPKINPRTNAGQDMAVFSTASPLYDNGLLYCLGNFGWMAVLDTKKTRQNDVLVYMNHPGFDFKLENDTEIVAPIGGKITDIHIT